MAKKKSKQKSSKPKLEINPASYDYHLPVMLEECCAALMPHDPDGIYMDGTLGGGGHTARILEKLGPKGRLISFDADTEAIRHCTQRFAAELEKGAESRLELRNENFIRACSIEETQGKIMGLLLDLGVSSHQLDSGLRGISHRVNARLDMRFGSQGKTAEDILNESGEGQLHHILRSFGEEPFARIIARRLVERRRAAPLRTTADLRFIIEECVPPHLVGKTLARVFQALRIAVNEELDVLEQTLRGIAPLLAPGGRIVILSYHSLEDRIVKNVFRELSRADEEQNRAALLHTLTPKPLTASEAELAINPRARSAKLRIAEKIG
jgi:16S rRNA (cytosine1402-N4)-methyltransferase